MKFLKRNNNKALSARDAAWMSDIQEALFSQTTPKSRLVLWLILLVFAGFLTWAHFAKVEEITKGDAKIVSKSREQIIQSLEGGLL